MNVYSLLPRRTAAATSICSTCRRSLFRQLTAPRTARFASYQAYTLPQQAPQQPRNASVPDTSIAQPVEPTLPRVHETRPPRDASSESSGGGANADTATATTVAIPEQEAQQSKAAFADPSSSSIPKQPSPSQTSARPRSKLRAPRKAAMKLTPAAVAQIRGLLEGPDPKLIKVGVRNRGCSGLAYHLEYVDKAGAFDETVEQDGARVLIDSKALFSILGSEMDWVEDKLSQRFVFRNPNIKEQCGCGESFMV